MLELFPDSPVEDWLALANTIVDGTLADESRAFLANAPGYSREDLVQECLTYALERAKDWDEAQASFLSFTWQNMFGVLRNTLNRDLTGLTGGQYPDMLYPDQESDTDEGTAWDEVMEHALEWSPEEDYLNLHHTLIRLTYSHSYSTDDARMVLEHAGMLGPERTTRELSELLDMSQSEVVRRMSNNEQKLSRVSELRQLNWLYGA